MNDANSDKKATDDFEVMPDAESDTEVLDITENDAATGIQQRVLQPDDRTRIAAKPDNPDVTRYRPLPPTEVAGDKAGIAAKPDNPDVTRYRPLPPTEVAGDKAGIAAKPDNPDVTRYRPLPPTEVAGDKAGIAAKPDNPDVTRYRPLPPTEVAGDKAGIAAKPDNPDVTRYRPLPPTEVAGDKAGIAAKPDNPDVTRYRPLPPTEVAGDKAGIAAKPDNPDVTRYRPLPPTEAAGDKTRFAAPPKRADVVALDDKTRIASKTETETAPVPESESAAVGMEDGQSNLLKQRFVLEKVLGAGGMGVVYKAKDLLKVEAQDRDPYVAIKVLGEDFKTHPQAFIALQRESRKSQRIAHPNIVNVFDFDRDGDNVFMTMEYLEGQPLDEMLRQYHATGLPTDSAWPVVEGMCEALMYAHAEKIIHSDFKPGNVFVTNKGTAKVFDFGIARAVAKVEKLDSHDDDRTVFDATELGALTPAYASLEMLEGKTPDIRDDVYALGCVVYEIFTGRHPFNKVPADEAQQQGLRPERIPNISKRQWRVIEKSLAFKREDRIASVDEFWEQINASQKSAYKWVTLTAISVLTALVVYFQFFQQAPQGISEDDIRDKVEYQVKLDILRDEIKSLMEKPEFSPDWEEDLWLQISNARTMLSFAEKWLGQEESAALSSWLSGVEQNIYELYLQQIEQSIKAEEIDRGNTLIANARRYTDDPQALQEQEQQLAALAKQIAARKKRAAATKPAKKAQPKPSNNQQKAELALANIQRQVSCPTDMSMSVLEQEVKRLKTLNASLYQQKEAEIIETLVQCILQVARTSPETALQYRTQASRIFRGNQRIASIYIAAKDSCNASLAGLGARGRRSICRDRLPGAAKGPSLLVIPAGSGVQAFAISKYELSIGEWNSYCQQTSHCAPLKQQSYLPATNISIAAVKKYLAWLSNATERRYRLPTQSEWRHAVQATGLKLDPNRNCKLSTRGIQKGQELIKTTVGKQNAWGLVNAIGNAQEWGESKNGQLLALGGTYNTPMDKCSISAAVQHSGNADALTGVRVVRELVK